MSDNVLHCDGREAEHRADTVHDETCLLLAAALVEKPVMQVPSVCLADRLAAQNPSHYGKEGVKYRYAQREHRHNDCDRSGAF